MSRDLKLEKLQVELDLRKAYLRKAKMKLDELNLENGDLRGKLAAAIKRAENAERLIPKSEHTYRSRPGEILDLVEIRRVAVEGGYVYGDCVRQLVDELEDARSQFRLTCSALLELLDGANKGQGWSYVKRRIRELKARQLSSEELDALSAGVLRIHPDDARREVAERAMKKLEGAEAGHG